MVYFAIKNGEPIHHRDIEFMREQEGVEPTASKTEAEFLAYENLVRVIDGSLFFGKTQKEKDDEAVRSRIQEIDNELKNIDSNTGERSTRESFLWLKQKFGEEFSIEAVSRIEQCEARANELRTERRTLEESLEIDS
jgi:hypothetical protein